MCHIKISIASTSAMVKIAIFFELFVYLFDFILHATILTIGLQKYLEIK